MSTSSTISFINPDGVTVKQIWVHWDGYLSHNGAILQDHYQGIEKVKELITLDSLSVLGTEIGEQHDLDKTRRNDEYRESVRGKGWCTSYYRDGGEHVLKIKNLDSVNAISECGNNEEYNYLFNPKKRKGYRWSMSNYDGLFKSLRAALKNVTPIYRHVSLLKNDS